MTDLNVQTDPNKSDSPLFQESLEVSDDNEDAHQDSAEELFDLTSSNPPNYPQLGDKIQFLDKEALPPTLVMATVTRTYKTVQKKYPGTMWFNVQRDDLVIESSADLLNTRWRFINRQIFVDPLQEASNAEASSEPFNDAFEEEPQLHEQLSIPFNEVQNLELVLPLTSTPTSDSVPPAVAGHSRPRLSAVRPRGMLPMEMDTPVSSRMNTAPSRFQQAVRNRAQQVRAVLSLTKESSDSD